MESSIRKNKNKNLKPRIVPWKSRKIDIKYLEKKESRMVTFTKRRNGLFSMASKLSALTGAEIAVIAISEAGTAYAEGSMAAIDRFLAANNAEEPNPVVVEDVIDEALANEVKEEDRFGLVEVKEEEDWLGLIDFGDDQEIM